MPNPDMPYGNASVNPEQPVYPPQESCPQAQNNIPRSSINTRVLSPTDGSTRPIQHNTQPGRYSQPMQPQYPAYEQSQFTAYPPQPPLYYPSPSMQPTAKATAEKEKKPVYLFILLGVLCASLVIVVGICVYAFILKGSGTTAPDRQTLSSAPAPAAEAPAATQPPAAQPAPPPTVPKQTEPEYLELHLSSNYVDFMVPACGYVIEDSNTRLISESELYSMTEHQVCIARNEIFARHGRKFKDERLSEYFNALSWYNGRIDPAVFDSNTNHYLSSIEQENIKTIAAYEARKGW